MADNTAEERSELDTRYCGRIVDPKKLELSYADFEVPVESLFASLTTSGFSHGYSWKYSQPVVDTMIQAAVLKIVAYGLGDDAHWLKCGDHVSKPCSGHAGWITAVDLMSNASFNAVDFVKAFMLPAVKVGFFPEVQYMITDYKLWDRKYGWTQQTGGDGPDHAHISHTNSFALRATYLTKYDAWKKAGRPAVVAWLRNGGSTNESGADVSMVALSEGRSAIVVRGSDKAIYTRIYDTNGNAAGDWVKINVTVASAVDACTRTGKDLWIVGLDTKDKSVLLITAPDATKSAVSVQDLGGTGLGAAPGIVASDTDILVSVAGTAPHIGEVYLKRWNGDVGGWSDWASTGGVAR